MPILLIVVLVLLFGGGGGYYYGRGAGWRGPHYAVDPGHTESTV